MRIMTEEQRKIVIEVERIARNYAVPRAKLLLLLRLGFESGQRDGLTAFANMQMGYQAVQA